MFVRVEDPDDPRLADYRELQAAGQRSDPWRFIAESGHVVARLLQSAYPVRSVLGTASHLERLGPELARRPEVAVYVAEQAVIAAAVGANFHRGVAACGVRPPGLGWSDRVEGTGSEKNVEDMVEWTGLAQRPRFFGLLAQGLADPANIGAIVRAARAFAVDLVVLDRRGADPLSRRAIRASAGNVFNQAIVGVDDLARAVGTARAAGVTVLAATLGPAARPLQEVTRPDRLMVMVGSEGEGLPAELIAAADGEITIPLAPGVDSLGVAAACAILLHALAGPGRPAL